MSGHTIPALMIAAGIAFLVYAAVIAVSAAYSDPGSHVRRRTRRQRRAYHRLAVEERRIWRQQDRGVRIA